MGIIEGQQAARNESQNNQLHPLTKIFILLHDRKFKPIFLAQISISYIEVSISIYRYRVL